MKHILDIVMKVYLNNVPQHKRQKLVTEMNHEPYSAPELKRRSS